MAWPHRGFTTIVISHVVFCTAYATVTVQSRLQSADQSLEEAAMDLGSGPARAFIEITLPTHRAGAAVELAVEFHALAG